MLSEYERIGDVLSKEVQENKDSALLVDLIKLILWISDYFLVSEEAVQKVVFEVMGRKVLLLESARLFVEGTVRAAQLIGVLLEQDTVEEAKLVISDKKLREKYYTLYNV